MKKQVILLGGLIAFVGMTTAARADEGAWLTNLPKAEAQAKTEHKLVLMDFNGSDWCPPCKLLRKKVLSSPEFMNFAKANLVLVDVDFPHAKPQSAALQKANEALAQKFDVDGFPTLVVLGSDGKQLDKKVGYGGESAQELISELKKLKQKS